MRIVVLPADTSACGSYRLKWPTEAVSEIRPDWKIETYLPGSLGISLDRQNRINAVKGIENPTEVDAYYLQRVGSTRLLQFIQWAQSNGSAVVADSDDAMWSIHPKNPAAKAWNSKDSHWKITDEAARLADVMTVTTEALASRYGKHGRVEILPNAVPRAVLNLPARVKPASAEITLGWAGFTDTHPDDLKVVGDSVKSLVEWGVYQAAVLGDAEGAARDWGLSPYAVESMPPVGLGPDYYTSLTRFDVGLVPLQDSIFNRAKSYLKALEYSSMGVPAIVSDTPAHRELARTVPLRIARTPAEWRKHLTELADPTTRLQTGAEARAAVEQHHTIEGRAENWASAIERAVTRRRRLHE